MIPREADLILPVEDPRRIHEGFVTLRALEFPEVDSHQARAEAGYSVMRGFPGKVLICGGQVDARSHYCGGSLSEA